MTNQNNFKLSKALVGRLLAIFSIVLSVFSLILFCTTYLNNKSLSDSIKALQTIAICFVIATSIIFAVYYLFLRQRKNFEFLVSIGLISLSVVLLINIIATFVTLSEKLSKTSKYVDVSPMITNAIATVVIPIFSIVLFAFSAYFIFKKKSGKLLALVIIPAAITVLSYISVPIISTISSSSAGVPEGAGTFLELFALCELSIYATLFVLGLDLGEEYKNNVEALQEKMLEAEKTVAEQCPEKDAKADDTNEKCNTRSGETNENEIFKKIEAAYSIYEKGAISQEEYESIKAKIFTKL